MKKKLAALAIGLIVAASTAPAQSSPPPDPVREAIVAAALDYSDGAYSGDAVRMARAISPDLNKLTFGRRSPAMGLAAFYSTFGGLVEMTRLASMKLEPGKRRTDVTVLESADDVACVRLKSSQWCDYLTLIKDAGQWRILNVLWTAGLDAPPARRALTGFDAEKEKPAARAAALDYLDGLLARDPARLEKAIHPETCQAVFMVTPDTKAALIDRSRYTGIIEPAKAKLGPPAGSGPQTEVRVLDLMDGMAFAAARLSVGTAYLELQLLDGQWKVINALIRPADNTLRTRPSSENRTEERRS